MTSQDLRSIATTTRTLRAGKTPLTISFDYTSLVSSIPNPTMFQLLIEQVVKQWHDSLPSYQKSALPGLQVNLSISALSQSLPRS